MADLIVRLYDMDKSVKDLSPLGIRVIRPLTPSKHKVLDFIKENFSQQWASEAETAFYSKPVTCFVAVNSENDIIGFAAYDATSKGFFGPIGVKEEYRHTGLGTVLLKKSLIGLSELGYAYAIIGGTGDAIFPFYNKTVGAEKIAGSGKSIYKDLI